MVSHATQTIGRLVLWGALAGFAIVIIFVPVLSSAAGDGGGAALPAAALAASLVLLAFGLWGLYLWVAVDRKERDVNRRPLRSLVPGTALAAFLAALCAWLVASVRG